MRKGALHQRRDCSVSRCLVGVCCIEPISLCSGWVQVVDAAQRHCSSLEVRQIEKMSRTGVVGETVVV